MKRLRTRTWLPLLALGALGLGFALLHHGSGKPAGGPSVLVQLTSLKKGSLPRVVTAYGTVEPNAAGRMTVMAPVAAVVARVFVRQGEAVAKGAPLIELTPTPPTAAAYAQAQSALNVADDLLTRTRQLVDQHLATGQQLADAEKSAADAHAALAALRAQGAGGSNVLRAPAAAFVAAVSAAPGAIVTEGAALLDLAAPQNLVLRVGVIAADAAAITPGDTVAITPVGAPQELAGKVVLSGRVIDPGNGLVPIDISLPQGKVLPGEVADARITTGRVEGYVVPHAAILVDDSGRPYVVQAVNMVAKKISIQVLASEDDHDVISGSLDPASPVVLTGNHQLEDGMKVRLAGKGDPGP